MPAGTGREILVAVLVLQLAVLTTLPSISVIINAALSLESDCTVQEAYFCVAGLGEISRVELVGNGTGAGGVCTVPSSHTFLTRPLPLSAISRFPFLSRHIIVGLYSCAELAGPRSPE